MEGKGVSSKCMNLLNLNIVECRALFQKDRSQGNKDDAIRHTMVEQMNTPLACRCDVIAFVAAGYLVFN